MAAVESIYQQLAQLARRHGAVRLVMFGSRARGDHSPGSDIDLAVYGMPPKERGSFWAEAEELPTLLKLDILHMDTVENAALRDNIEKEGVDLL